MFTLANLLHTYLHGKHKKDKKQHKSDSLRPIRLKYNDYPLLFTSYLITFYFLQIVSWRLAKLGGKAFREIAG